MKKLGPIPFLEQNFLFPLPHINLNAIYWPGKLCAFKFFLHHELDGDWMAEMENFHHVLAGKVCREWQRWKIWIRFQQILWHQIWLGILLHGQFYSMDFLSAMDENKIGVQHLLHSDAVKWKNKIKECRKYLVNSIVLTYFSSEVARSLSVTTSEGAILNSPRIDSCHALCNL